MEPAPSISAKGVRYELVSELASGGMATVYVANAAGDITRRVALKRIHRHLAKDASFRAMFLDEARIVSRIEHPNVCRILDYGDGDGEAFIAMELLRGVTVQRALVKLARAQPSDARWFRFVTTLAAEAAEGLHAAHEARDAEGVPLHVVHRDISPSNLFLTRDGQVKVLDFGIAKARDRVHVSSTGEVKGKYSYMAPEQLRGEVDRRADVWSLGVVHYEMLTMRRLFRRGTQPETIMAVERDPIPPPSAMRPEIAHLPCDVGMDALERDIARRLPSARAFADRLHASLEGLGGLMSRRELADYLARIEPEDGAAPDMLAKPPTAVTARAGARPAPADELPAPKAETPRARVARRPRAWRSYAAWGAVAIAASFAATLAATVWWSDEPAEASTASLDRPTVAAPAESETSAGDAPTRPETPPAREAAAVAEDDDRGSPGASPESLASDAPAAGESSDGPSDPVRRSGRTARRGERGSARPAEPRTPEPSAQPPPAPGTGSLVVPRRISVCLDRPCGPGVEVLHGYSHNDVPAGTHRVFYVSRDADARIVGERTVAVPAGGSVHLPATP